MFRAFNSLNRIFSEKHQFSEFEEKFPEEYPFIQDGLQIIIPASCSFPKKIDWQKIGIETIVRLGTVVIFQKCKQIAVIFHKLEL